MTDAFQAEAEEMDVLETTEAINQENYYEKTKGFFSYSQFKGFKECEARELAKIRREYVQPSTPAMILGSYFHAAFESPEAFEKFQEKNGEHLFKKNGEKTAATLQIDKMIEAISNDEYALAYLQGEKEQVFTGELYGKPFKIRVDNVNHFEEFFSDLKSSKGLYEKYWDSEKRTYLSFIEKFDYVLQAAIYQEILYQNTGVRYKPFIVAATKEDTPDKAVFHMEQWRLDDAITEMRDRLFRYDLIKQEYVEPVRCEKCDYCRGTKTLSRTMEIGEIIV